MLAFDEHECTSMEAEVDLNEVELAAHDYAWLAAQSVFAHTAVQISRGGFGALPKLMAS